MEQKPTIGRIVHFQYFAQVVAAIITYVHEDGGVALTVFPPGIAPQSDGELFKNVKYSETPKNKHWSWPPRT